MRAIINVKPDYIPFIELLFAARGYKVFRYDNLPAYIKEYAKLQGPHTLLATMKAISMMESGKLLLLSSRNFEIGDEFKDEEEQGILVLTGELANDTNPDIYSFDKMKELESVMYVRVNSPEDLLAVLYAIGILKLGGSFVYEMFASRVEDIISRSPDKQYPVTVVPLYYDGARLVFTLAFKGNIEPAKLYDIRLAVTEVAKLFDIEASYKKADSAGLYATLSAIKEAAPAFYDSVIMLTAHICAPEVSLYNLEDIASIFGLYNIKGITGIYPFLRDGVVVYTHDGTISKEEVAEYMKDRPALLNFAYMPINARLYNIANIERADTFADLLRIIGINALQEEAPTDIPDNFLEGGFDEL